MTDELRNDTLERERAGSPERDGELAALLRKWEEPQVPAGLDARVIEAYRSGLVREPLWKRLFTFRLSVPLPVALAALVLLLLSATALVRQGLEPKDEVPQVAGSGAETQTARGLEAPVVTQTSLAGFEPVDDVNVLVMQEAQARR
jgi:hypothetical protein